MARKYLYIVLTFSVMLIGCRPEGVISSRQMRTVLIDLHKADAILQVSGLQHGYDEEKNLYYATILDKHGITQAEFDSSLVWYTANPQLFDKIYPKVLAELESERDIFFELHAEELGHKVSQPSEPTISSREAELYIDSILWVMQNGYPSTWNPYYILPTPPFLE